MVSHSNKTLELSPSRLHASGEILVRPRWPSKKVVITEEAYRRLCEAQRRLGAEANLVLTRGMESGGRIRQLIRRSLRSVGGALFSALYPGRRNERQEIFCSNGHDSDGNHIDIRIEHEGKLLVLLPFGVFTPDGMIVCAETMYSELLNRVWSALRDSGFEIHTNRTEALQIHCDAKVTRG